jgi:hypothetical protein
MFRQRMLRAKNAEADVNQTRKSLLRQVLAKCWSQCQKKNDRIMTTFAGNTPTGHLNHTSSFIFFIHLPHSQCKSHYSSKKQKKKTEEKLSTLIYVLSSKTHIKIKIVGRHKQQEKTIFKRDEHYFFPTPTLIRLE